jgi:4-hydroxy-2-oxoglutarate aldolase
MKQILHRKFGCGKNPRRPLLPMSEEKAEALMGNEWIVRLMGEEEKLLGTKQS